MPYETAGCVRNDDGDCSCGGSGIAGGGGGTTSWTVEEAVGEPGGGAGGFRMATLEGSLPLLAAF